MTSTIDGQQPQEQLLTLGPESLASEGRAFKRASEAWALFRHAETLTATVSAELVHQLLRELWPDAGEVLIWDAEDEGGGDMMAVIAVRGRDGKLLWCNPILAEENPDLLRALGGDDTCDLTPMDDDTREMLILEVNSVHSADSGFFPRCYDKALHRNWYARTITLPDIAAEAEVLEAAAPTFNDDRVERGRAAVAAYAAACGVLFDSDESLQTILADFLGDLRLWALRTEDVDYDEADLVACQFFAQEKDEE